MKDIIIQSLKEVIDPELDINVYDLGLIYEIVVEQQNVTIIMTLTTQGCPLHDSITSGVRYAVSSIPNIKKVDVQLVWEPAWEPSKMSDLAKAALGHI